MSFTTLIDADALAALMASATPPGVLVLDASFDLADATAGMRQYEQSHLPGAQHVDLERDLSGPKQPGGVGGRHPLPERAVFAATAGRLGVVPGRQVVVYDRSGGFYAARAWWLLRWLGHETVAVLDGGLAAWAGSAGKGRPLASGPPSQTSSQTSPASPQAPCPAPYPTTAPLVTPIDADTLLGRLGRWPLIDARAANRFRGEVEPLDRRAGHIPGARNRFYGGNLGADGRFKPATALRAEFTALLGAAPPAEVVHQCGSGVTACHNLLAMEHAGLAGSRLYAGSWSEWSADPARPWASG